MLSDRRRVKRKLSIRGCCIPHDPAFYPGIKPLFLIHDPYGRYFSALQPPRIPSKKQPALRVAVIGSGATTPILSPAFVLRGCISFCGWPFRPKCCFQTLVKNPRQGASRILRGHSRLPLDTPLKSAHKRQHGDLGCILPPQLEGNFSGGTFRWDFVFFALNLEVASNCVSRCAYQWSIAPWIGRILYRSFPLPFIPS